MNKAEEMYKLKDLPMRNRHTLEREVMASRSGSDPMNPLQQADGDRICVTLRTGIGSDLDLLSVKAVLLTLI